MVEFRTSCRTNLLNICVYNETKSKYGMTMQKIPNKMLTNSIALQPRGKTN